IDLSILRSWFAQPWALWLLLLLPVLGLYVLRARRRRRRALSLLGNPVALQFLLVTRLGPRRLRGTCVALGLLALIVGIAGPQWGRDWEWATAPGRDLVVLLDVSRSMLAEQPSRQ